MKIIKYLKVSNDKYKIYFENGNTLTLYEEVIVKHNLIYKKEITENLYEILEKENLYEDIYMKCVKYIEIRLRSKKEIEIYLKKKNVSEDIIDNIIKRLEKNKLLEDNKFCKAFINDKIKFTSMGPYKIKNELYKLGIDKNIIEENINSINQEVLIDRLNKIIEKKIKANHKDNNYIFKNKIYNYLLAQGYSSNLIMMALSNYNFE